MGRTRDYQAGLFNEFEKLNEKLDKLLKENKSQSLTIYNLNLQIGKLNKIIQEKKEKNKKNIRKQNSTNLHKSRSITVANCNQRNSFYIV